jgi:cation diffusion facilitator family transporter
VEKNESRTTVWVALAANLGIAVIKTGAAVVTRSSALFAEAAHAFADTGNGVILLVAERRGGRPPDERHPLGHGADAYFWALLASLGVFITGGVLSIIDGIDGLTSRIGISSFPVAYVVLGLALVFESASLWRVHRQLRGEARRLQRDVFDHVVATSDPVTRAVFAEDLAAVAGNVVALIGVGLHQATGSSIPDGIAAIVIGLGLAVVAFVLAARNRAFLIGEQAPSSLRERLSDTLRRTPGIVGVDELLVTFVGPRRVHVLAAIDVRDDLTGGEVEALLRDGEQALRATSDVVARVDLVPRGIEVASDATRG